jgi:hypothetical protein
LPSQQKMPASEWTPAFLFLRFARSLIWRPAFSAISRASGRPTDLS